MTQVRNPVTGAVFTASGDINDYLSRGWTIVGGTAPATTTTTTTPSGGTSTNIATGTGSGVYVNPATGQMSNTQGGAYTKPIQDYNPGTVTNAGATTGAGSITSPSYKTNPDRVVSLAQQYGVSLTQSDVNNYSQWNQSDLEQLFSNTATQTKQKEIEAAQAKLDSLNAPVYQTPDYSQLVGAYQQNAPAYQPPDYSGLVNAYQQAAPAYQPPDYTGLVTSYAQNAPQYQPVNTAAYQAQAPNYAGPDYQAVLNQYGVPQAEQSYDQAMANYQQAQLGGLLLPQQGKDALKNSSWALGLSWQDLDARLSDPNSPTYVSNPFMRDKILQQAESAQKATISDMLDKITAIYQTVLGASQFASESKQKELDRVTKVAQEAYESLQWLAREQYTQQWTSNRQTASAAMEEAQYANRQNYQTQSGLMDKLLTQQMSDAEKAATSQYNTQADLTSKLLTQGMSDLEKQSTTQYNTQADLASQLLSQGMQDQQTATNQQYNMAANTYEKQYDTLFDLANQSIAPAKTTASGTTASKTTTGTSNAATSQSDELLSPAEAKTLGVPYGTTVGEAAKMNIVPGAPTEADYVKEVSELKNQMAGKGYTYISSPSQLAGLTEGQITRKLDSKGVEWIFKNPATATTKTPTKTQTVTPKIPTAKDYFTSTQLAKGASVAGMTIDAFGRLSVDEANKYINSAPKSLDELIY